MTTRLLLGLALTFAGLVSSAMVGAQTKPKPGIQSGRGAQLVKTPIEILELRRIGPLEFLARIDVGSENKDLQTLIFVQDRKSDRFGLASDRTGKSRPPGFPFVTGSRPGGVEWTSEFSSLWKHPSIKVFAVVAAISDNARFDRDKEFDSLRYVPFSEAVKIEDVLRMLADFKWRPQGYTFLDAPY
jgi:hypothetical protein